MSDELEYTSPESYWNPEDGEWNIKKLMEARDAVQHITNAKKSIEELMSYFNPLRFYIAKSADLKKAEEEIKKAYSALYDLYDRMYSAMREEEQGY